MSGPITTAPSAALTSPSEPNDSSNPLKLESEILNHNLGMEGEYVNDSEYDDLEGFNPFLHTRELLRLIQCSQCSRIFRSAVHLPCGNAVCRGCIPKSHKRKNITYPPIQGREEGFYCVFPPINDIPEASGMDTRDCEKENVGKEKKESIAGPTTCTSEHAVADCGLDVTLNNVVSAFQDAIERVMSAINVKSQDIATSSKTRSDSQVEAKCEEDKGPQNENEPDSREIVKGMTGLQGGRLINAYRMAEEGNLAYDADLPLDKLDEQDTNATESLDRKTFGMVKDSVRSELDCNLCYSLFLDPLTTGCGHTFCRPCLIRAFDHSRLCPVCRKQLPLAAYVQSERGNHTLSKIIGTLFSKELAARLGAQKAEDIGYMDETEMPLFVCTLSFPSIPTFLHVFEPRYRLMIRRVLESGTRRFGMVMLNRNASHQRELGYSRFKQYGTVLMIDNYEILPDGRSFISTIGVSRFKVVSSSIQDGYHVGRIERVEDIPTSDEEQAEAHETGTPREDASSESLDHLSTDQLFNIGLNFVAKRRAESLWLNHRILASYGVPPSEAALFPYWLAAVLPITDEEKYKLLQTISVRQRLKICAYWIKKLETAEWYIIPYSLLSFRCWQ